MSKGKQFADVLKSLDFSDKEVQIFIECLGAVKKEQLDASFDAEAAVRNLLEKLVD